MFIVIVKNFVMIFIKYLKIVFYIMEVLMKLVKLV